MDIEHLFPLLIPIIAIVMGVGIGMLVVYLNYRKRKEMFALYHQERMAAIDKGIELPPLPEAFFSDNGKAPSPHDKLLMGLVFTFLGVALFITLYFLAGLRVALIGALPLGVGLALLLYYFAVGKKEAEAIEAERRAKSEAARRS